MLMKKILTLILVVLSVLSAASAAPVLSLYDGNMDGLTLYAPDGSAVDSLAEINESGMVIQTTGNPAVFVSDYGDIHLEEDSLLAVTGFSIEEPSLYLVYGEMSVVMKSDLAMTIFTPASIAILAGEGEYSFISTDDAEIFRNYSNNTILAYDGIRGIRETIEPMEVINYLEWPRSVVAATPEEYYATSVLGTLTPLSIEEAEEEETEEIPTAEVIPPLVRTYTYAGYTLTATVDDGMTVIEYPAVASDSDVHAFIAIEDSRYDFSSMGVAYTIEKSGKAVFTYPGSITREDVVAHLDALVEDLIAYITAPAVPDAPTMLTPSVDLIRIPSAPAVSEPSITPIPSAPSVMSRVVAVAPDEPVINTVAVTAETPSEPVVSVEISAEENDTEAVAAVEETEATAEEVQPVSAAEEEEAVVETAEETEDHGMPFDLRFAARAYGDTERNSAFSVALRPYFSLGGFTLGLNLDPYAIIDGLKSTTVEEWIGFATDFIEEISYSSENLRLAIDRRSYLKGDTAMLFSGLNHAYDGTERALSLDHSVSTEFYGHRLWADDLSIRRTPGTLLSGLEFSFSTGDAYPAALTLGAAASIRISSIEDTVLYPEASLYLPFIYSDTAFGIRFSAATMMQNFSSNPFEENGMLLSATLPFSISGFTFEAGAAWSTKAMHIGMLDGHSFTQGSFLSVIARAEYAHDRFGFLASGWMDINTDTMKINAGNSAVDASLYADLWGIRLFGGFRTYFGNIKEEMGYYAGLSTDLGPLESVMMMDYSKERGFALSLSSSVSLLGNRRAESDYDSDFPISTDIETGFEYDIMNGGMPLFTITPRVTFGNEETSASFRAPFRLDFDNNGWMMLAGFNGHEKWDFGIGETDDIKRIYKAVVDSLAIIDSINLGNEDESIAYLLAERGYRKQGAVFTDFGTDDALSVRAGFNFPNLSLSVYVDNAEAPHITEAGLTFYPGSFSGPSFSLRMPGEVLFTDMDNYTLIFYPGIRFSLPFADKAFELSIYAMGEVSTSYEGGSMTQSKIIYDFENKLMTDYIAGASAAIDLDVFAMTVEGGIRNGHPAPDMFNSLTAAMNTVADTTATADASMDFFAKASMSLSLRFRDVDLSYTASDLLAYPDGNAGDYLAASIKATIADSVTLYASFAKDDFYSSLTSKSEFLDYITEDALFTVGADFSFGHVGFTAELKTLFPESEGQYLNVPSCTEDPTVSFTVKSRLVF